MAASVLVQPSGCTDCRYSRSRVRLASPSGPLTGNRLPSAGKAVEIIVAGGCYLLGLRLGLFGPCDSRLQLLVGVGRSALLPFQRPGEQLFEALRLGLARLFQIGQARLAGVELLLEFGHPFRQGLGPLLQQVAFLLQGVAGRQQLVALQLPLLHLGGRCGQPVLSLPTCRRTPD